MHIYFTPPKDLLLAAPTDELDRLGQFLGTAKNRRFAVDVPVDPSPYFTSLSALVVKVSHGPVLVAVHDSSLCLEGDSANLATLGSFFASAALGSHVHYEWYPGNEWIDAASIPLVIERVERP